MKWDRPLLGTGWLETLDRNMIDVYRWLETKIEIW